MDNHFYTSGHLTPPRFLSGSSLLSAFFLVLLLTCGGCSPTGKNDGVERLTFSGAESAARNWEGVFQKSGVIRFSFPDKEREVFKIGSFDILPTGNILLTDPKIPQIYEFNGKGEFIREIGRKGQGPGEYVFPSAYFMDSRHNIYVNDRMKKALLKYRAPEYACEAESPLPKSAQDMFLTDDNTLIRYLTGADHLLEKTGLDGTLKARAFTPPDTYFHQFQTRFQLGRLLKISDSQFLMTYPGEYAIWFFDFDLRLQKVIQSAGDSRFTPAPPKFPRELSVHDYTPAHAKWWESALHISRLYPLTPEVVAVQLLEFSKMSARFYLNIHDFDGKTLALGLEIPREGVPMSARDGVLYVAEQSALSSREGVLEPPVIVLYRYTGK